jgi:hypothetical protein
MKLTEQLEIMKMEDEERSRIGKTYIKDLFEANKKQDVSTGDVLGDEKARQQERLVLFNEFASD